MPEKVETFKDCERESRVMYIETVDVAEGVVCDTYSIEGDDNTDLAVVGVAAGCKTPRQRILHGDSTIEGYMSGKGVLSVTSEDGKQTDYVFPGKVMAVVVEVGDIMQWTATTDMVFYEKCTPPYKEGRFENLPS